MKISLTSKRLQATLAVAVTGGLLYALSIPLGPLPPLGPTFSPGTGIWTSAKPEAKELVPKTQALPGMRGEVQVAFDAKGTPHLQAAQDRDAFLAIGYLHGQNRLFQMDLMRRKGRGLLSEVVGAKAIEVDTFQRQLGMVRTAEEEWVQAPALLREVLEAYAEGVNAAIDEQKRNGTLPLMFKMLGYEPSRWVPQDSLVMKGLLSQMMSLKSTPILYELLANAIGEERTTEILPIVPPTEQLPYAAGPYRQSPLQPFPVSGEAYFQEKTGVVAEGSTQPPRKNEVASASLAPLLERLDRLPSDLIDQSMNSNAWVVGGSRTASGKAMMASDPHLDLSIPSIWYQLVLDAPTYRYSGVTVPGMPFALVGFNDHISWGLTNGENQQTFYYREQTDDAHKGQYFWKGTWHPWSVRKVTIPVKGQDPVDVEVRSSVHGPLVETEGMSLALNWLGMVPNGGAESLRKLMLARNYEDFKDVFAEWGTPTMNFAYSDRAGNIGMIAAGAYPVFPKTSKPWLVLSGTGEDDIIGAVPFADLPQTYNPPNHVIVSANQRQTTADYPYYIGTSNDFEPGYRVRAIQTSLAAKDKLTADDFAKAQYDVTDTLAKAMIPTVLELMKAEEVSPLERQAIEELARWDYRMTETSSSASVWWTFLEAYKHAAFDELWAQGKLSAEEHKVLDMSKLHALDQVLEKWTLTEPERMKKPLVQAFRTAVEELRKEHGDTVANWTWGTLHTLEFPHVAQVDVLGYAPRGAQGNRFTPNMADGMQSSHGPSWRMIVDWGTEERLGIYPGGQSENPLSPLYLDRVETWWEGRYDPILSYRSAHESKGGVRWTLRPQDGGGDGR